jgi:CBS domain containing-hemolysin-like protein
MQRPLFANEAEPAEKVFMRMKREALHMAVVLDGDGNVRGILTLEDILENIVGDIESDYERNEPD